MRIPTVGVSSIGPLIPSVTASEGIRLRNRCSSVEETAAITFDGQRFDAVAVEQCILRSSK